MKKALIWVGCFLLSVIINMLLLPFGVKLGYVALPVIVYLLPRYLCIKLDIWEVKKEAESKGMSIRQLVASVVPPSLFGFCEVNKGESSIIKSAIKKFIRENAEDENPIPKRYLVVLREMYE